MVLYNYTSHYVTLCVGGGSKGKLVLQSGVATHRCVTTSIEMHIIMLDHQWYGPGLLYATGETTTLYKARHIDIDCGFEFRCY